MQENQWQIVQFQKNPSKDSKKLEELAELAISFENLIRQTHKCTIAEYQDWLHERAYGAKIDIDHLTPLEIQLIAYTVGVKIGVLPINVVCPSTVDKEGRIIPEGEFYGPNTKEFLLMGANGASYYGLFPKLNIEDDSVTQLEAYGDLFELEGYWTSIDMNKPKKNKY